MIADHVVSLTIILLSQQMLIAFPLMPSTVLSNRDTIASRENEVLGSDHLTCWVTWCDALFCPIDTHVCLYTNTTLS